MRRFLAGFVVAGVFAGGGLVVAGPVGAAVDPGGDRTPVVTVPTRVPDGLATDRPVQPSTTIGKQQPPNVPPAVFDVPNLGLPIESATHRRAKQEGMRSRIRHGD